ncbi:MAG: ABC transporter permease [Opitutae bacterium]|nr:ABC transporter permease [Opitutae bacterium]
MKLLRKIHALFRKGQLEAEMAAEMRHHLELQEEANRRAGLAPAEARDAALRQFGNVASLQERGREARGWLWLEHFRQDLRYAARSLRKSPGFTAVVVLTLALGIGANAGIFSVLRAVAWRPLPVRDPAGLVNLHQGISGNGTRYVEGGVYRVSYPEYLNYRDRGAGAVDLLAFEDTTLTQGGVAAAGVRSVLATGNYFAVLGATAEVGRLWTAPECEVPGACAFVVLGYDYWRRQFGGDRDVVGHTLALNGQPFTILGVAAPDFRGVDLEVPDLWVPLAMRGQLLTGSDRLRARDLSWLRVLGRLRPGVALAQAGQVLSLIGSQAETDTTLTDFPQRKIRVDVRSAAFLNSPEERSRGLPIAAVALSMVGLVLVVVCANVSNLLLARAAVRRREIGVRLALGASRGRLIRQLLTESLLLAGGAGLAGLALTALCARLLPAIIPGPALNLDLTPDWAVAAYCAAVSVAAGFILGLLPALQATRVDLLSVLSASGARLGDRVGGTRLRHLLVIVQVAVSCVLLIAAGLLVRGLQRAMTSDLGFARKNVLVLSADPAAGGYAAARASAYYVQLADRLAALPGVKAVGLAAQVPLLGARGDLVRPDTDADGKPVEANCNLVSPGYFAALDISLVRGRGFVAADQRGVARVAVVSQTMANRFWAGLDPVGRRFSDHAGHAHEIIGVARDTNSLLPGRADGPFYYLPTTPQGETALAVVIRTEVDWRSLARTVGETATTFDPRVAVSLRPMEEIIGQTLGPAQLAAALMGALGLLTTLLVAVGLYGVIAYVVNQRTQEIGVRMALGAGPGRVQRQIVADGVRVVAVGLGAGGLLAAAGSRVLQGAIFGLSPLDPVTFAGVGGLLLAIAAFACWLPARRAAKVDPMIALRAE